MISTIFILLEVGTQIEKRPPKSQATRYIIQFGPARLGTIWMHEHRQTPSVAQFATTIIIKKRVTTSLHITLAMSLPHIPVPLSIRGCTHTYIHT